MAKEKFKSQNEMVKYNNELAELPLRNFTAGELDIFMTLCAECKNKNSEEIKLPFSLIKKLSGFTQTNRISRTEEEIRAEEERNEIIAPQSFVGALKLTNKKLLNLNMELRSKESPGVSVQFNLFTTFITDERNNELRVKVNEDFSYILNELTSEFTQFELAEFVALRSSYAKGAYRQMKRFKDTGIWYVTTEKFKRILDIPASYKPRDIEARVIDKITSELTPIFKGLTVEKIFGMKSGRGRTSIIAYKFTWEPIPLSDSAPVDFEVKASSKTTHKCPVCGKLLYQKEMNGSVCWCHPDNYIQNMKDGGNRCVKIFNTVEDIYRAAKDAESSKPEEPLTAEEAKKRELNIEKLKSVTNDIFSDRSLTFTELKQQIKKDVPDWQLYEYNCLEDLREGNNTRFEKDLKIFENALEEKGYKSEYVKRLFLGIIDA